MDGENVLNSLMHECFGNIISSLDEINDYAKELCEGSNGLLEGGTSKINTIPYGKPGGCHSLLVVIIDGKKDVDLVLNKALMHVGLNCKGITKYVLFYVANDYTKWDKLWSLYKPSFDALKDKYGVIYFIHLKNSYNISLTEINNMLLKDLDFQHFEKPSDDVSELLIYGSNIRNRYFFYKILFAKSNYSLTKFSVKIQQGVIRNNSRNEDIFNIIKEVFKNAKGDLAIDLDDDYIRQLTYHQVILNEQELCECIRLAKELKRLPKGRM